MTLKELLVQEIERMTEGQLATALTLIQGLKMEPNPVSPVWENLIIRSPETCGNRPRINGTRMTVGRIATLWQQGLSAEAIYREYPHLTLVQIYAALAYYHANGQEIEQGLAQDQADYERYSQIYAEEILAAEIQSNHLH
jgi:uncharacterized protein (DUF433 family)